MKLLVYLLVLFFVTISTTAVHAQNDVTPTLYCLGSCPNSTPSSSPSMGIGPSVATTSTVPSPSPSTNPCVSESAANSSVSAQHWHGKHHRKFKENSDDGFFEMLFRFLLQLLQILFGNGNPNGSKPVVTPSLSPSLVPSSMPSSTLPSSPPESISPCLNTTITSAQPSSAPSQVISSIPKVSPSPSSSNPNDLIFTGDFETGNLSQWADNQSCPTGVTIVTNPVRKGKYSAKFTTSDSDTNTKCNQVPTNNPRAQLVSKDLFKEGDDYYIGFSTLFPSDFPNITDWFQIMEIYGPPFGGSPSMEFDVTGNKLTFSRDETHNYDKPWTAAQPIVKNAWQDIVIHVKFSTDPTVGFVEIWLNGVKQTFTDGTQRLYYDTLVPDVNWQTGGADSIRLNQYRSNTSPLGTVTIYHDEAKAGKTYASVAP